MNSYSLAITLTRMTGEEEVFANDFTSVDDQRASEFARYMFDQFQGQLLINPLESNPDDDLVEVSSAVLWRFDVVFTYWWFGWRQYCKPQQLTHFDVSTIGEAA